MPKINPIEQAIPRIYRHNALNTSMFAFVRGVRKALHTISVPDAIALFMEDYGLDDDDYSRTSALTTYNRLQKELLTLKRSNNGQH